MYADYAHKSLSERNKLVLDAIVNDYINSNSAEPIGSKAIYKKHNLSISPATIRNVASDLEEMGYLVREHSSSGRVPTDKGFRFYVDRLLRVRQLTERQKDRITQNYNTQELRLKEMLDETSKVLSKMSKNVGLVVAPKLSASMFEHIEFVKISKDYILVIFVTKSGNVFNKKIRQKGRFSRGDLQRISNYLNDIMHNLSLAEIRKKILQEMQNEKMQYDNLFSKALAIFNDMVEEGKLHDDLYIQGASNIFNDPIFKDITEIKKILRALEDKKLLINILDKSILSDETVLISIGKENDTKELSNCSVVTSNYGSSGNILGTLGVIGPVRMDYARIIPLVGFMSKLVSRLINISN